MKAAVYERYGPPEVWEIKDVPKSIPKANEILIKVRATTINRTDCGFRSAEYFITRFFTGILKPRIKILGTDLAGEVVEVGSKVTNFKPGDRVFGFDDFTFGGHAEFAVRDASKGITKIPGKVSYEMAVAAVEGGNYALNYLDAAKIGPDTTLLVYGASGAIGSSAVQLAKAKGATVTAVCGTKNVKVVKKLGADKVIDYEKTDFTDTDERYDLILDAVGKSRYKVCKKLLKSNGKYSSSELGPYGQNVYFALWFLLTGSRRVMFPIPKATKQRAEYIASLLKAGKFKPLIDRTSRLEDIVKEARYAETGQKTGNIVLKVG